MKHTSYNSFNVYFLQLIQVTHPLSDIIFILFLSSQFNGYLASQSMTQYLEPDPRFTILNMSAPFICIVESQSGKIK